MKKYRTKRVYTGLPQDLAWKILDQVLDQISNWRSGMCAKCGENIRLQGYSICMECWEAMSEMTAEVEHA